MRVLKKIYSLIFFIPYIIFFRAKCSVAGILCFFCFWFLFFCYRHRFQIFRLSLAARRGARWTLGAPLWAPFDASRLTPPSGPPLEPGRPLAVLPTTPGNCEIEGESQKKKNSQGKKNITINENIIQQKHEYPYNTNFWCNQFVVVGCCKPY